MRKFVIFSLVALLTSQAAAADNNSTAQSGQSVTKHGTVGQVQGGRYVAPAGGYQQPRYQNTGYSSFLRTYILLLLFQNFFTTTKAPEVTATTVTTKDPCMSWAEANGCRYKIFSETISWNQARTNCQNTCSSKLAHEKVRDAAGLNAALGAVSYNSAPIWMGISDEDSASATESPKWDKTTAVTTLTFAILDYATAFGTPGCGFYAAPQAANLYKFERCTFTDPVFTPKQYLCEVC